MNIVYPTILSALEALRVTLTLVREEHTVYVEVNAPLYTEKHYRMKSSWSADFSDAEILRDASGMLASRYGIQTASGFTTH